MIGWTIGFSASEEGWAGRCGFAIGVFGAGVATGFDGAGLLSFFNPTARDSFPPAADDTLLSTAANAIAVKNTRNFMLKTQKSKFPAKRSGRRDHYTVSDNIA